MIIALGGGSPMDAAKVMWLMYEHPDTKFGSFAMRFMDIRKRWDQRHVAIRPGGMGGQMGWGWGGVGMGWGWGGVGMGWGWLRRGETDVVNQPGGRCWP